MSLLLHSKYLVSWKTEALGNALLPEILKFSVNGRIKPGTAHSFCVQEFIGSQIWVSRTGRCSVLPFWNRERFLFPKLFSKQVLNADVPGKDRRLGKLALVLSVDQHEGCVLAHQLIICLTTWLIIGANPTVLIILMDGYFFYLSSAFNKNLKAFFFHQFIKKNQKRCQMEAWRPG